MDPDAALLKIRGKKSMMPMNEIEGMDEAFKDMKVVYLTTYKDGEEPADDQPKRRPLQNDVLPHLPGH